MFLPDLIAYLAAYPAIAALPLPQSQIYNSILKEPSPLPALVIVNTPTAREYAIDGQFSGLHRDEFEIECWAMTDAAAANVKDIVIAALNACVGKMMGSTPLNGIVAEEEDAAVPDFGLLLKYMRLVRAVALYN